MSDFVFPADPAVGDTVTAPNGQIFVWTGTTWDVQGTTTTGGPYLPLNGGQLTGPLTINVPTGLRAAGRTIWQDPDFAIDGPAPPDASTPTRIVAWMTEGAGRWGWATWNPSTGVEGVGSDLSLERIDNAGTASTTVLFFTRATGRIEYRDTGGFDLGAYATARTPVAGDVSDALATTAFVEQAIPAPIPGPPGDQGPPGPQGDPGPPGVRGAPGPTAISKDAGNIASLGSDGLLLVLHDASKYDASNPTGYITAAAVPVASSTAPAMDGTASAGTQPAWSRGDHVHARDTSRMPLAGVTDGSNAAAGNIGEFLSASNTAGTALTSATTANIATLNLTPGDWDVSGLVSMAQSGGSAGATALAAGFGPTSATLPTLAQVAAGQGSLGQSHATFALGTAQTTSLASTRFNVSAATAIYLTTQATFTSGAYTATGFISARRVR